MQNDPAWPISSIVYHIYPRSFRDTNNDGIGDLAGVEEKLDYLVSLGINAIWLSPIYKSPQTDFGYDVSDYKDIDPIFGTLSDFDYLLKKAHEKNIKIMMDYVPNHTSSEHKWFEESRKSKNSPKRDWYIWADPKPDGSPPNNWLSVFGGSAWEMDSATGQYYLHSFDKAQPDLNYRNPAVADAMLSVLRFWLDRGVDGFRVDALDWTFKDPLLRDEPQNPNVIPGQFSQYDTLIHARTFALDDTIELMKKIVDVLKEYDHKFVVAEAHLNLQQLIKRYIEVGWKWYQPFNFSLINLPWKANVHKQYIDEYDKALGDLYIPCYVLGNHDKPRVDSRIGTKQARVAAILQLTLRGLPFIYYGEEIGMTNMQIPREKMKDPFEKSSPGLGLGRDPQRTPMQWSRGKYAGFSSVEPWLPVNPHHKEVNVIREEGDPKSMLSLYKLLIKLKKHHPALREGKYIPLPHPSENVLAFLREKDEDKLLILLNFDDKEKQISMDFAQAKILCEDTLSEPEGKVLDLTNFKLEGNEGYILQI